MFKRIADKFNRFIEQKRDERWRAGAEFANSFLYAVERNEKQAVDVFFDQKGVDPNGRLAQMAMCAAARDGLSEMVDQLLGKGVAADSLEWAFGRKTAIDVARENGHNTLADKLQKAAGAKAKPNAAPNAP